jgi:hypothetical protein
MTNAIDKEIHLSYVPGHEGECRQVDFGWDPTVEKHLPIFRNVQVRWWWPFHTQYGAPFFGEPNWRFEIHEPTKSHLRDDHPRRVSRVDVGEATAMARGVRPASVNERYRKYVEPTPAPAPYGDPYTSAPSTPLWRHTDSSEGTRKETRYEPQEPSQPKWQGSGGGGDFAGAGASGDWESDKPVQAVASSMSYGPDNNYEGSFSKGDAERMVTSVESFVNNVTETPSPAPAPEPERSYSSPPSDPPSSDTGSSSSDSGGSGGNSD